MDKIAARITSRKHQGFLTHLKAAGHTDAYIEKMLPKYAALDAKRTSKLLDLRAAIVPAAA